VTLPEVALDDLRFQALVNECRARVAELCPEWTEANVSDPGITLIELFAWMTDQLSYRINRVPEKLHVALLALLDVHLYPPSAARVELRLRLVRPPERPLLIPARVTEATTTRAPGHEPVVFQTLEDFTIMSTTLDTYLLQRGGVTVDVTVRAGEALPAGDEQRAFSSPPQAGDCLLLGFEGALDRLVMRLELQCAPARGVNVVPSRPPLAWEVYVGGGTWQGVDKLCDSTEGFNEGNGEIELALPARTAALSIGPYRRHWLRCRVTGELAAETSTSNGAGERGYKLPPLISSLRAAPIGATLPAEHSQREEDEVLGRSDGTPGQIFRLRRAPILALTPDEGLEVREPGRDPVRWAEVQTFADSGPEDRHYKLDEAGGEIELGPIVRQPDGTFRHYGAIPSPSAELRFVAYRHGGGTAGNVVAGSLQHLRRPIPGVRSVANPAPATGGVDGETLGSARARMAIELRTRHRAVTADDFEQLCHVASGRIARAHCLPGGRDDVVRVLVVPRIESPRRALTIDELTPDEQLLTTLKRFLDERRLVGITVAVGAPQYRGVSAIVRVVAAPHTDRRLLERRIEEVLYGYLNPLIGGSGLGEGTGWDFERALSPGELHPLIQRIEGVKEISLLRMYETDLSSGQEAPQALDGDLVLAADELIASGAHRVKVDEPAAA
jgi:predicted phage baseplate assembly protein